MGRGRAGSDVPNVSRYDSFVNSSDVSCCGLRRPGKGLREPLPTHRDPTEPGRSGRGAANPSYLGHTKWRVRLGSGHRERESLMFSFRRSAKPARPGGNQRPEEEPQHASFDAAASAEAARLRDLDPVHTFTATAELRRQDARYGQLWPSDVPHRRRRDGK